MDRIKKCKVIQVFNKKRGIRMYLLQGILLWIKESHFIRMGAKGMIKKENRPNSNNAEKNKKI